MKDIAIILSHRLEKNGDLSEEYKERLKMGMELFKKEKVANLILCSETATESTKSMLIKQGIPPSKIFLEKDSKDTIGEAFFSKLHFLIPKNWKKVVVISSDYHVEYRVRKIFDFLLGPNFEIEYSKVETPKLNDSSVKLDQMISLKNFENLFKNILPGDDKEISKKIYKNHRLYLEDSKYNKV